jgi:hypothetical protein
MTDLLRNRRKWLLRCTSFSVVMLATLLISVAYFFPSSAVHAACDLSTQICPGGSPPTMVTTFQLMRPDPNNSANTKHVTVLSIRLTYRPQLTPTTVSTKSTRVCVPTPEQQWQGITPPYVFAWGSTVYADIYQSSDCSGASVDRDFPPGGPFPVHILAQGQVKKPTCWVNLNNIPNFTVSGCW